MYLSVVVLVLMPSWGTMGKLGNGPILTELSPVPSVCSTVVTGPLMIFGLKSFTLGDLLLLVLFVAIGGR